jgi:hypothetical protein
MKGRHSLAALCLVSALGCGSAVTPALVQCKLEALRVLPADPEQATVADARDLVARIKACHAAPDAGQ